MKKNEIWLFFSVVALFTFSWPLLAIFWKGVVVYLFASWAVLIVLAAIIAGREKGKNT